MRIIDYLHRCILIIFFISIASKVFADVKDKPVVIISIDAESHDREDIKISLLDQFDLKIDGIYCGITKMMKICEKHNVRATFFLNVYEYKKYGESEIEKIARQMDKRGFDVQLHTHPQWAYDKEKRYMHQYTLKEQKQIIKDGKNLLKKWINKDTVIHRAGAYGANEDTLKALYANNIFYDSSFFFLHPKCLLQSLNLKKNYISISNDVYQIPVNVFTLKQYASSFNFLEPLEQIVKYDIDWTDSRTLITAIDKGIEHHFDAIVLFLHSFSFIKNYNENRKIADKVDIQEFDDVLEHVNKKGLRLVTFNAFIDEITQTEYKINDVDYFPVVNKKINIIKFQAKKVGINRKNFPLVIFYVSVAFAIILVIFVYLIKRRRYI